MNRKITGLVIAQKNYRESDRLVTLLHSGGITRAYAKAAQNVKSKKFAGTALFCYADFVLHEGKSGLYIIDSADEKEVFFGLRQDIERLALAQYFCELLASVTPETADVSDVLRLCLNSLYCLCETQKSVYAIKSVFELRLMCELGFLPNLVACTECGKYEDKVMYFDPADALLYCGSCVPKKPGILSLTPACLAALRHIALSEFSRIFSFSATDETMRAVSDITEKYVLARVEKNFKTLKYFNSVRI